MSSWLQVDASSEPHHVGIQSKSQGSLPRLLGTIRGHSRSVYTTRGHLGVIRVPRLLWVGVVGT